MPVNESNLLETATRAAEHAVAEVLERGLTGREFLPTKEAAFYLGLSAQRLAIWRSKGGGPYYSKTSRGGVVRYKRSDLDEFMRARRVRNTSEVPGA